MHLSTTICDGHNSPDGGAARVAAQRREPLAARGRVCLAAARFRVLGWPARVAAIVS